MDIASPSHSPDTEDYTLECQEALDLPLADLIDRAIAVGWAPRKVFKAIEELARNQAAAYEEDPDPAESERVIRAAARGLLPAALPYHAAAQSLLALTCLMILRCITHSLTNRADQPATLKRA